MLTHIKITSAKPSEKLYKLHYTLGMYLTTIRPDSPPARCRQAQEGTMAIGAKVMSVAAKPTQPSAAAARSSEVARCGPCR